MANKEGSDIVFSWTSVFKWLALCLVLAVFTIILASTGGPKWLTVLMGLGTLVMLVGPMFTGFGGNSTCPLCNTKLKLDFTYTNSLFCCPNCNDYLVVKAKKLIPVGAETILEEPTFGVSLPWNDLEFVVSPTIDSGPVPIISKKGPKRKLPADWPDECCVCGREVTHREIYTKTITKAAQGASLRDEEISLVANNVPYCDEHQNGVAFGMILIYGESGQRLQFLFHSYTYRNKFRDLNEWA